MKNSFLMLSMVIGALVFASPQGASATMSITFTGGKNCTCTDGDNWDDIYTGSSVTLTCPNTAPVTYTDAALSGNILREYSCSSYPGAASVQTDNLSGKVMVSYADRICPKGYTLLSSSVSKGTTTAGSSKTLTPVVGLRAYCAKGATESTGATALAPVKSEKTSR